MAKSARASSRKTNRSKLRARVFGPVELARAERLSEKLKKIIEQPRPSQADAMELESSTDVSGKPASTQAAQSNDIEDMQVENAASAAGSSKKSSTKRTASRIQKKRRVKAANQITFANYRNGKRVQPIKRKSK